MLLEKLYTTAAQVAVSRVPLVHKASFSRTATKLQETECASHLAAKKQNFIADVDGEDFIRGKS